MCMIFRVTIRIARAPYVVYSGSGDGRYSFVILSDTNGFLPRGYISQESQMGSRIFCVRIPAKQRHGCNLLRARRLLVYSGNYPSKAHIASDCSSGPGAPRQYGAYSERVWCIWNANFVSTGETGGKARSRASRRCLWSRNPQHRYWLKNIKSQPKIIQTPSLDVTLPAFSSCCQATHLSKALKALRLI
ncbi:Hypothetical_protein [Hexamita inflata]|uniref:Hypothetical_protein n=1 Tax=Hexamita inflata TaxID=28002 RepID=A0ABP1GIY1_9EUKA